MSIRRTTPEMTPKEAEELQDGLVGRTERAQERYEIWVMDQHLEGDFKSLLDDAHSLARRRHDYVHALWGRDTSTGEIRRWRNGISYSVSIDELQKLAVEIFLCTWAINTVTRPDLSIRSTPLMEELAHWKVENDAGRYEIEMSASPDYDVPSNLEDDQAEGDEG